MTRALFALALSLCFPLASIAAQTTVNVNNGGQPTYGPAAAPTAIDCPTPPTAQYVAPQPMTTSIDCPTYVPPQPMTRTYTTYEPRVRTYTTYEPRVRTYTTYEPRTYTYQTAPQAAPPPMYPLFAYRSGGYAPRAPRISLASICLACRALHHAKKAAREEAKAEKHAAKAARHAALAGDDYCP